MRVLVTGARGMLGADLICILEENGHQVFATDIEELDITKFDLLFGMTKDIYPDIIVNCAAYTAVDKAEQEPEKAFWINGHGAKNLALVCKDLDIALCHISTDYVFDGTKKGPYFPHDLPHPINSYGYSKLEGEKYIQEIWDKFYIIRTSWLYGRYGKNFVYTVLSLAQKQKELRIVDDQMGSPTWTVTLSRVISKIIHTKKYGLFHVTDKTENGISWYEFAKGIIRLSSLEAPIIPIKTKDMKVRAYRPKNSVLDLTAIQTILSEDLPWWEKSLKSFLSQIGEETLPIS